MKTYLIYFGLIIISRLILLPVSGFSLDVAFWQAWAARLVEVGPLNFYAADYFADYFPGYLYLLWLAGHFFNLILSQFSISSDQFIIMLKIITNAFDFLAAYFIFKIIRRKNLTWAYLGALFYLGNPAVIFNSTVWGQVDGILSCLLIIAAYCLIDNNQPKHWAIFSGLALLVKPQGLIALPVMLVQLIRQQPLNKILSSLAILGSLPVILAIPFFPSNPIWGLFDLTKSSANIYPYSSINAFNFWSLEGFWQSDLTVWIGIPLQIWGLVIYLGLLSTILISLRGRQANPGLFYLAIALSILAAFLFATRVHERYLLPFFAFMIVTVALNRSLILLLSYFIISVIHLINLWYVYFYYQFVYEHSSFTPPGFYRLVETFYPLLSLVTIAFFFIIWFYLLSRSRHYRPTKDELS